MATGCVRMGSVYRVLSAMLPVPSRRTDVVGRSSSEAGLPDQVRDAIGQADRTISTGQLHVLPRFHLQPIDVVVYHGSQRDLVLRGASRLDAFSGYPVRT